jgi:hypothetical protein
MTNTCPQLVRRRLMSGTALYSDGLHLLLTLLLNVHTLKEGGTKNALHKQGVFEAFCEKLDETLECFRPVTNV